MKDINNQDIKKGDYVLVASCQYDTPEIRFGKVLDDTKQIILQCGRFNQGKLSPLRRVSRLSRSINNRIMKIELHMIHPEIQKVLKTF